MPLYSLLLICTRVRRTFTQAELRPLLYWILDTPFLVSPKIPSLSDVFRSHRSWSCPVSRFCATTFCDGSAKKLSTSRRIAFWPDSRPSFFLFRTFFVSPSSMWVFFLKAAHKWSQYSFCRSWSHGLGRCSGDTCLEGSLLLLRP